MERKLSKKSCERAGKDFIERRGGDKYVWWGDVDELPLFI
jgi:hypothetical protein